MKIDTKHVLAWVGKGNSLAELGKYKQALSALRKAINLDPKSVLAHTILGEVLLDLGNLEGAHGEIETSLSIDINSVDAWALKGRVEIETQNYDGAIESFRKVISLSPGDPLPHLWYAYAYYLKAELHLCSDNKVYQEKVISIIRCLEKAEKLVAKPGDEEIRAHVLYFLGCFYYKSKDVLQAMEKLRKCVKIRSKIKRSARELLENIWNYQIRPSLWRFWFAAPLNCWPKGIFFIFLLVIVFSLFLLHPFVPSSLIFGFDDVTFFSDGIKINWNIYILFLAFLLFIVLSPIITRIKAKDIEVEIKSPPPFELGLWPASMAEAIRELEKSTAKHRRYR